MKIKPYSTNVDYQWVDGDTVPQEAYCMAVLP